MSKNITIQESGVAKQLTVDKLSTAGTKWIPEDAAQLDNITVNENGTIIASDKNVYGFDEVTIDVTDGSSGSILAGNPHTGEISPVTPAIKEGGVARTMGLDKRLKTGDVLWIPEASAKLGILSVNENGTYNAAMDGLYGYSRVVVNVNTTQVGGGEGGIGGDIGGEGGDDPYATENLPDRIAGTPLKIAYNDGDLIVLQDGDIKAYKKQIGSDDIYVGNIWKSPLYPDGGIPAGELTIDPTTATYDENNANDQSEYEEFGEGPWPQPIVYTRGIVTGGHTSGGGYYPEYITIQYSGYIALLGIANNNYIVLVCDTSPGVVEFGTQIGTKWPSWDERYVSQQYTYNNKTVYYSTPVQYGYKDVDWSVGINQSVGGNDLNAAKAAWTIVYGTQHEAQEYTDQTVTVTWPRPVDSEILTCQFHILVYPAGYDLGYGDEVGGGGTTTGGGGAGRPEHVTVPDGITATVLAEAIRGAMGLGVDFIYIGDQRYTLKQAQAMIDQLMGN